MKYLLTTQHNNGKMLLRESELILWTHLSLVSKDAPIPSVSILNFWLTPFPKSVYKTNAALAVWIIFIHMLEVSCDALTLCMISASVESPQNLRCRSEHSSAQRTAQPWYPPPPPCLAKITRYSFTVLSICHPLFFSSTSLDMQGQTVVTRELVVYACDFQPSPILSVAPSNLLWNGGNESSLHPVVWKGGLA